MAHSLCFGKLLLEAGVRVVSFFVVVFGVLLYVRNDKVKKKGVDVKTKCMLPLNSFAIHPHHRKILINQCLISLWTFQLPINSSWDAFELFSLDTNYEINSSCPRKLVKNDMVRAKQVKCQDYPCHIWRSMHHVLHKWSMEWLTNMSRCWLQDHGLTNVSMICVDWHYISTSVLCACHPTLSGCV